LNKHSLTPVLATGQRGFIFSLDCGLRKGKITQLGVDSMMEGLNFSFRIMDSTKEEYRFFIAKIANERMEETLKDISENDKYKESTRKICEYQRLIAEKIPSEVATLFHELDAEQGNRLDLYESALFLGGLREGIALCTVLAGIRR
jgi:hypothetical protein